ncbi:MAG: PGF-CTERM sorting domain-containing protein, partial [Methanophagales archaeon]|nr:PGF-CTERM sorting domain-containing protein [Methanophagales archaeon]
SVDITFTGTGIALITVEGPNRGIMKVKIDGKSYPDIDMYYPSYKIVTKTIATDLTSAQHVLTISPSEKRNSKSTDTVIVVDAVDITIPTPATFEVGNLVISPTRVEAGKPVMITVDVTNTGEAEGTYTATLKIDDIVVETKDVTLTGGSIKTATFSPVTKDATGTYTVNVGGQTGIFRVLESATFIASNLVAPSEVEVGKLFTITADVTNTGEVKDTYIIALKIEGKEIETKKVSVAGGETETVGFTVIKDAKGVYNVTVNGQTATFTVIEPKKGIPGFEVIFAIVGLSAVAYLLRRK